MKRLEITKSRVMPEMFSSPPDGVEIIDSGERTMALQAEVLTWADFAVSVAKDIPAGIISAFLYDVIKRNSKKEPTHVTINQVSIRFEKGEIAEFIETKVTETKE